MKVASTESGIIFGNIVYDVSGVSGDRSCVVLNDIHIDIMDYILPSHCSDEGKTHLLIDEERALPSLKGSMSFPTIYNKKTRTLGAGDYPALKFFFVFNYQTVIVIIVNSSRQSLGRLGDFYEGAKKLRYGEVSF